MEGRKWKLEEREEVEEWKERMERGGLCVCRGWFLVCLMDNVVTRFCTR